MNGAQDPIAIVLNRGDGACLVAGQVPPGVGGDAMAVGVGPRSQGGVPGSGLGVGVIVVTVFEVGALVEEKAEAPALEVSAVAVEVVTAKLVNHQDDHQPRMRVVGTGPGRRGPWNNQKSDEQLADTALGGAHVAPTSIAKHLLNLRFCLVSGWLQS